MSEMDRKQQAEALEAAVPGVHEMLSAWKAALDEMYREEEGLGRMMAQEGPMAMRSVRPYQDRYESLAAGNPRAALYVEAKRQSDSAHWADNSGRGAAGDRAMEILASGGSVEDATAALQVRKPYQWD